MLTEIAGHKFIDGLMRDRCSRCDIRWAEAIAGRVVCVGCLSTDYFQSQFDAARQEMWDAVTGSSSGARPAAADAANGPVEPDASPYCFSFAPIIPAISGNVVVAGNADGLDSLSWAEIIELLDHRA